MASIIVGLIIAAADAIINASQASKNAAAEKTQVSSNNVGPSGSSYDASQGGAGGGYQVPQIVMVSEGGWKGQAGTSAFTFNGKAYATQQEAQAAQQAWITANPAPTQTPGSPAPGPDSNIPGGKNDVIPNQKDVIDERAYTENLQMQAYEEQGLTSIMGLKEQEASQESSIRASSAARGLRLEGSPLFQLQAQQTAGAAAIGSAETQLNLGVAAQLQQQKTAYNAGLLSMSDNTLQIQTDLSNAWLSSFTGFVNDTSSFLGKFWNPAQTMATGNNSFGSNNNIGIYGQY